MQPQSSLLNAYLYCLFSRWSETCVRNRKQLIIILPETAAEQLIVYGVLQSTEVLTTWQRVNDSLEDVGVVAAINDVAWRTTEWRWRCAALHEVGWRPVTWRCSTMWRGNPMISGETPSPLSDGDSWPEYRRKSPALFYLTSHRLSISNLLRRNSLNIAWEGQIVVGVFY